MSEKFDLPFESNLVPKMLDLGSRLKFRCYRGISCYNACCKKADITLTPYDVIRLKDRLGKSSSEFLRDHTVPFRMDKDGLPGVKLMTDDEGVCNFMNEAGCSVYSDRPTACRYYPLGHMSMLSTGAKSDETHYFLVHEEHCKGHAEELEQSIAEYLKSQETAQYDEMNREWMQLMLKRRSMGPTVGRPPEATLQLFFMASYDMERFRRFVLSENFRNSYQLDDSTYEVLAKEDLSLMQFGVRFMRQAFFGERTIEEQTGAWERRVEQRKEVWEARRQAEISRHQQAEDEKYKDA
ncbi:MAG: YkgJ family cysteine cluster protein [Gammaproteobacteria bacterium]|nr:YkgJ family cysteine cluster protein [Gammaproteobacteria bacterium]